MEILIGATASLFYLAFLYLLSEHFRYARLPILIGGMCRLIMAWIIGLRLANIQGTTSDAMAFERRAAEWAKLPWYDLLDQFDPSRSYVISWVGAIIYKISYPSPVLLNIVNAALSTALIVMSCKLATILFDKDRGRAAAWIVALFPFAILYGSVFRREVFGSFFFMLGLFSAVRWSRKHGPWSFVIALVYFLAAGVFHSGYAFGAIGLILFAMTATLLAIFRKGSARNANILLSGLLSTICAVAAIIVIIGSGFSLNKIGEIGELDVNDAIQYRVSERVSEGGSSYPGFLTGVDPFSNPVVIPGRTVYFVLSPFPWDIRAASHILGLFATVYYFLMLRSIFVSRKTIRQKREALVVTVITFCSIMVFAVSIDNIGTSIRHRTKFIYPLATLCAAPLFERLKVRRKKNRMRHEIR